MIRNTLFSYCSLFKFFRKKEINTYFFFLFAFIYLSAYSVIDLLAEILEAETLSVTLDEAQLPRGGAERPLDMAALSKSIDELVKDFARLGSAQTNQLRNEFTCRDLELHTIEDSDTGSMGYNALVLLSGSDLNGDLLVQMEDILNSELLVILTRLRLCPRLTRGPLCRPGLRRGKMPARL